MIRDRDLYDVRGPELVELRNQYKVTRVPGTNEFKQSLFQVTHGCGHTETIGSHSHTTGAFICDSMMSELERCSDCYDETAS